jgi:peptidoglycan/xylan/chitin deacetylase (PgdA/CDA1 family)
MRDVELEAGYRSSWNLVPEGYDVDPALVHELSEAGFEVGVHGLRHDGRDFSSSAVLEERLVRIRSYAARWQATGYRSPSTLRVWDRMPGLGFDYDSSYSDTAPFEPQPGGCCSMLPYFNQDLVELPITLPQDHTLFVILGHDDESLWLQKAALIKAERGMALLLTHPDYATPPRLDAYRRFLEAHASDSTAWRALPRDVSAWWRSRAASRLERHGDGWRIVGPASERGRILFT